MMGRRREQREQQAADDVLAILNTARRMADNGERDSGQVYGLDLVGIVAVLRGKPSTRHTRYVYVALARLEATGQIISGWWDGPAPRRRWYAVNPQEDAHV